VRLAQSVGYSVIGTMEFLVQGDRYVFIEANARLQVGLGCIVAVYYRSFTSYQNR
jgi:biotin carboxylase